jgi:transposase
MVRHRLTDEQWALIADLFPEPKQGAGRPPSDPPRISQLNRGFKMLEIAFVPRTTGARTIYPAYKGR